MCIRDSVERLVEGALVRGAVTEEADADLIRAAYLGGEARARGDAVSLSLIHI